MLGESERIQGYNAGTASVIQRNKVKAAGRNVASDFFLYVAGRVKTKDRKQAGEVG